MTTSTNSLPPPDAIAVLDEAGLTAKVRNLSEDHDGKIGLVAALMLPTADLAHWEAVFEPPFTSFKNAAPPGAKLHITDAYGSADQRWIAAANAARQDIFSIVRAERLLIAYLAREASIARKTHEAEQDLISKAKTLKPPHISISERPSETRLVSECYEGLVSLIDILAETAGSEHVAMYADEMDKDVLRVMEADAQALRELSQKQVTLAGFDKAKGTKLSRTLTFSSDVPGIDVTRVGALSKLGKSSSLVFAADVIVNALLHHLQGLPFGTTLNNMKSVSGWALEECVFAPPDERHDPYSTF